MSSEDFGFIASGADHRPLAKAALLRQTLRKFPLAPLNGERIPRKRSRIEPLNLKMRNALIINGRIVRFMGRARACRGVAQRRLMRGQQFFPPACPPTRPPSCRVVALAKTDVQRRRKLKRRGVTERKRSQKPKRPLSVRTVRAFQQIVWPLELGSWCLEFLLRN
jgi:hypothetical protein